LSLRVAWWQGWAVPCLSQLREGCGGDNPRWRHPGWDRFVVLWAGEAFGAHTKWFYKASILQGWLMLQDHLCTGSPSAHCLPRKSREQRLQRDLKANEKRVWPMDQSALLTASCSALQNTPFSPHWV